jgi:hypothetical protein
MWTLTDVSFSPSVCSPVRLILIKGILAYGRTKGYFYAYYVTKTLTAMVSDGSMMCLSLAYVVGYLHSQLGAHLSH